MRGIVSQTRTEWVKKILGANRSFTVKNIQRAFNQRASEGWITPMPVDGPAYEKVAMVHEDNPLAPLIRMYMGGNRWFARSEVEGLLSFPIDTEKGACLLAKAGFGLLDLNGEMIELLAADPNEALYVNLSRNCPQIRGYGIRPVMEAVLHIRRPNTRRINLTDDRRLITIEILHQKWSIKCDDLLDGRLRVRLFSSWTFRQNDR